MAGPPARRLLCVHSPYAPHTNSRLRSQTGEKGGPAKCEPLSDKPHPTLEVFCLQKAKVISFHSFIKHWIVEPVRPPGQGPLTRVLNSCSCGSLNLRVSCAPYLPAAVMAGPSAAGASSYPLYCDVEVHFQPDIFSDLFHTLADAAPRSGAALPIREYGRTIIETVKANSVTVVIGETGSGKTTQIAQVCCTASNLALSLTRALLARALKFFLAY